MQLHTRFGRFGGCFVPETVIPALEEAEAAFLAHSDAPEFVARLETLARDYAGRPTPLYRCENLSRDLGCHLWLKREDLLHGGAHKTNNALGQALLAVQSGKRRLIAETGAGQHGVATAIAGALFGLPTVVYMGAADVVRQRPNVLRMRLLGAEVRPVRDGASTLKDAINAALRDWIGDPTGTAYVFGTAAGPHPFPTIVRHFQSVIGREALEQLRAQAGRLPDVAIACVGGGSNAIGLFAEMLDRGLDERVRLIGVEAAGDGLATNRHSAPLNVGSPGVLHGSLSALLQDEDGQVLPAHSIAAGLDYPGVGPELAELAESGRVEITTATDEEALAAFERLARREGIIPALESAHALAAAFRGCERGEIAEGAHVLVNLSGRGDKDLDAYAALGRLDLVGEKEITS